MSSEKKKQGKEKNTELGRQLRWLGITIALCLICSGISWKMAEREIILDTSKTTEDTIFLPCGLPIEMKYPNRIESGIWINGGYYGLCVLDINFDENDEEAEVYISYYPDNEKVYGLPTYRRYTCIYSNGVLIEKDGAFIMSFDSADHSIDVTILSDAAYKVDLLDPHKDLVELPFHCIWIDGDSDL